MIIATTISPLTGGNDQYILFTTKLSARVSLKCTREDCGIQIVGIPLKIELDSLLHSQSSHLSFISRASSG